MIRIGEKYIRGSAVDVIEPALNDPENWSVVVIGDHFVHVNAPAAVVADRIDLDKACADVGCTEDHDATAPAPKGVLATLPAGYRPNATTMFDLAGLVFTVDAEGNVRSVNG